MNPEIYLSIDNCFASKRWTEPLEWMSVIRQLGLGYAEASADNECDPLYTTPAYLDRWRRQVLEASGKTGVRLSQMYSGHGTYATLGLCHTDPEIRRHLLEDWLAPMCRLAGSLGSALGFFCYALPQSALQAPQFYAQLYQVLCQALAQVAGQAAEAGCPAVAVEGMYTPHQPPWTLAGTADMLARVNQLAGRPFYVTVDTGHQVGQQHYQRPTPPALDAALRALRQDPGGARPWLGTEQAHRLFETALARPEQAEACLREIEADILCHPYLFAGPEDCETDNWLRDFGRYSPIIHLQQTDGTSSGHLPFTAECNQRGKVNGPQVLRALHRSYRQPGRPGMPPPAEKLYLTLEIFSGTAERPADILRKLEESVAYWRRYVPRDGLGLDELVQALG